MKITLDRVGRPDRGGRPAVQARGDDPLLAGRDVEDARGSRAAPRPWLPSVATVAAMDRPSGEKTGSVYQPWPSVRCRRPWVARCDEHQVVADGAERRRAPRADQRRAVGRDVERRARAGPSRSTPVRSVEVAESGLGRRWARPRRTAADSAGPEVVVPVLDRVRLEEPGARRRRPCAPSRAAPSAARSSAPGCIGDEERHRAGSSRRPPARRCPAGGASSRRASPPSASSCQRPRRRGSSAAPCSGLASGSGRLDVNTSEPSGRNAAWLSPAADRVRRRGAAAPAGSTLQSAVRSDLPSGAGVATATTRRRPSGDSRSPDSRGMAEEVSKSKGSGMPANLGTTCPTAEHREGAFR